MNENENQEILEQNDETIQNSSSEETNEELEENISDEENQAENQSDQIEKSEDNSQKEIKQKFTQKEIKKESEYERNKRYAEIRKSSYNEGIKTAVGNKNPFTNQELLTDQDVEDYLLMKEMDKKGLDPNSTSDFIKFKREKELENKKKEELEKQEIEKQNERFQKDYNEFNSKYSDVDINKLCEEDNEFSEFIQLAINSNMTLIQGYELYLKIANKNAVNKAQKMAKKMVQASMASPGSQVDGNDIVQKNSNYKTMSDEEFEKLWEKELKNL